jgi:hypothetical protein
MKSVDLRSSGQDSACLSGSQREEAVSDRMDTSSSDADRTRLETSNIVGRFMLLFFEGGTLCVQDSFI